MSSIQQFFQSFRHAHGYLPNHYPSSSSTCAVSPLSVAGYVVAPLLEELSRGRIRLAVRTALKLVLYIYLSADSGDLERVVFPAQVFRDHGCDGRQCYCFTASEEE